MKHEATRLTKAQQYEIIAKLSKSNAPSKRMLGLEYEVSEGAIQKVWDNRENILQRAALMSTDAKNPSTEVWTNV